MVSNILKFAGIFFVVLFFISPGCYRFVEIGEGGFAVVFDVSKSMDINGCFENAVKMLQKNKKLMRLNPSFYLLHSDIINEDYNLVKATYPVMDINSILKLKNYKRILFISDCNSTFPVDYELFKGFVPVDIYMNNFDDVNIEVSYMKKAYVDTPFEFNVKIYTTKSYDLRLFVYVDGVKTIEDSFYLDGYTSKTYNTTFKTSGKHSIKVVCHSADTYKENNEFEFEVDVVKERTRILYITGKPSYDYLFLRRYLKSKDTYDLVSFVILREPFDVVPFSDRELSLIPFPSEAEFLKGIGDFDVYIFHDFPFSIYGMTQRVLELVKNEVYSGKSLILIPSESFSYFLATPLYEISGVRKNTGANVFSSIEYIAGNRIEFSGIRDIGFDGRVLIGSEYPVIGYRRVKKGTVFYINTDSLWKLGFYIDPGEYALFFDNVFNIISGEEADYKLEINPLEPYIADPVSVNLILKDESINAKIFLNGMELKTIKKSNAISAVFFAKEKNSLDFYLYSKNGQTRFTKFLKAVNPEFRRVGFNKETARSITGLTGGSIVKDISSYTPKGYFVKERFKVSPFEKSVFMYIAVVCLLTSWILKRIEGRW